MTDSTMPPLEVAARLRALRATLGEHEVEGLLITTLANVRYLTGFTGSAGVLAVSADRALLTTDGRYRTQSAEQVAAAGVDTVVDIAIGGAEAQRAAIKDVVSALARIGLEADNVTWDASRRWRDLFG